MDRKSISRQSIERLMRYARLLRALPDGSPANISATAIADRLGLNQVVVRKDLAEVSDGGRPRVGYMTVSLLSDIEHALGYDNTNSAVLVGAGNLGRALLSYPGFAACGVEISVAFDENAELIGKVFGGVTVMGMEKLENLLDRMKLHIGIITVPAGSAQGVCDTLVKHGILAIWNFAPTQLTVPDGVMVRNENMALSLSMLSQHLAGKI